MTGMSYLMCHKIKVFYGADRLIRVHRKTKMVTRPVKPVSQFLRSGRYFSRREEAKNKIIPQNSGSKTGIASIAASFIGNVRIS